MWFVYGKNRYYYRNRNIDGRHVHIYVGRGPKAEQAALEDLQKEAQRKADKTARVEALAALTAADAPVKELHQLVTLLTKTTLTASGFLQHDNGEWRKWRNKDEQQRD